MAGKDAGLKETVNLIRGVAFYIWAVLSTVLYGTVCLIIGIFDMKSARRVSNIWSSHLLAIGGIKISCKGTENLRINTKYVFISNHVSALDIPLIIVSLPKELAFLAKKELFYIPFFGWGMSVIGHIPVDRSSARKARSSISAAVSLMKKRDVSLVLFPEGTRSATGELGEFKHASFALAKEAEADIVPVFLYGANRLLPKKAKFPRPGTVMIYIGDPIPTEKIKDFDKKDISNLVRSRMLNMKMDIERYVEGKAASGTKAR